MSGIKCEVCGEPISALGYAYVSHMRKHVKEGTVIEAWDSDWGPRNRKGRHRGRYGYHDAATGKGLTYPLGGRPRGIALSID